MNGLYNLIYLTFLFKGDTVKGYSKYPVVIQFFFSIQITGGIKDLQIENKKRKNSSRAGRGTSSHRTESEVDSHDSSSISTLDQAVKQWMVAAASSFSCPKFHAEISQILQRIEIKIVESDSISIVDGRCNY